jgi:DNA processing protein
VSEPPVPWAFARGQRGYPAVLEQLPDPPASVHGVGEAGALRSFDPDAAVTIVGSRRASAYGIGIAEQLGHDLAFAGITVVSGMANGIDAAAHRGALTAGGPTIAVLGGGPDVVYPRSQRGLYRRIVESGAAISEHPPGTATEKWSFPPRNRIMAALGRMTIVVEAAEPSGTLITAERAGELGRDLGAVPGQVTSRVAAGPHALIRDGAALIRGAEDVLDAMLGIGRARVVRAGAPLDPELERVLDGVERGCSTPDAIAVASEIPPAAAAVALARLELLGYVATSAAGSYAPTGLTPPAD